MTYDTRTPMAGGSAVATRTWNLVRPDDIIGRRVIGTNDETIGTVGDLYLDYDEHTVRFATVDVGGFLGIGTKTVMVPFEQLQWSGDDVYLPVDKSVLDNAPEFDPMNTYDRTYEETVFTAWGTEPYWTSSDYGTSHTHWREGYNADRDVL